MSRDFLTPIVLPAGTASNAPLKLQSGTNLTNAAAGAVEYDGKVVYSTPAGRGVSPSMMIYRLNSGFAGANVNTAQSIFGVGVTLQASTIYAFKCSFVMSKTSGTVSHNIGLGFGGTATLNNILYMGSWMMLTASTLPMVNQGWDAFAINTASNTVITGASTTSSRMFYTMFSGTVSINAGGTFIPQYTLSAAPGSAYTTFAGSYFAIWPIGAAGANTSVGPWA